MLNIESKDMFSADHIQMKCFLNCWGIPASYLCFSFAEVINDRTGRPSKANATDAAKAEPLIYDIMKPDT